MSDHDESVDSRTMIVGRKRAFEDSPESGEFSGDGTSADEAYQNLRKRAKQDGGKSAEGARFEGGDGHVATSHVHSRSASRASSLQPSAHQSRPSGRALGWNHGVQGNGGIRTSFGTRKQLAIASQRLPDESNGQTAQQRSPENLSSQEFEPTERPSTARSRSGSEERPVKSRGESVVLAYFPARNTAQIGSHVPKTSAEISTTSSLLRSNLASIEDISLNTNEMKSRHGLPILQGAMDVDERDVGTEFNTISTPETSKSDLAKGSSQNQKGQKQDNASEAQERPLSKQQRKAQKKLEAAQKDGSSGPKDQEKQGLAEAAGPLDENIRSQKGQKQTAIADTPGSSLSKAQKKLKDKENFEAGTNTKKNIHRFKSMSEAQKNKLSPGICDFYRELVRNSGKTKQDGSQKKLPTNSISLQLHAAEPKIVDETESEDEHDTSHTSEGSNTLKKTPESILASLSRRELELQQKYFPTPDGIISVARCLACTNVDHCTIDCPSISCPSCGDESDHPASSCPWRQRCGRCRNLGHSITQCPEKLARLGVEAVPCDLCSALDHIESQCHMIWRSFIPQPQNIHLIQSLPIDCYTCGQSGHFGPDCGLYRGHGSITWSQANYRRYVNSVSSDQAICAGVDFTIPTTAKPSFSIKGMAKNPITLDDSDDNMSNFIQAKVNNPSKQRGHIRLGSIQAPSGPRRDQGREFRSDFGLEFNPPIPPNRTMVGPSRHGPERTFSPPPRFDNHSNYVAFDSQNGSGPFQDFSRLSPPTLPKASNKVTRTRAGGGGARGRGRGSSSKPPPANSLLSNGGSRTRKPPNKKRRGGKL